MSCFSDTEVPSPGWRRWLCEESKTAWWPDKSCDISHSTSKNCPQEVGTNADARDQLYSEQPRWCWMDCRVTDIEMTVRAAYDYCHWYWDNCRSWLCHPAPSLHPYNPETPLWKLLPPEQQSGGGSWTQFHLLPRLLASKIKPPFLSYQPLSLKNGLWSGNQSELVLVT